ncbi:AAA family ATPase [Bacillus sp. CECT 9360]|uniref:SbcC/MukB-like Walker B domain-containing protein n=1 Tax=Bacillus sp. CECT 9360 TaxID=2845821 RepID=UPI001E5EDB11|nr:AAA family ATPase [Bacillus sp. CECT 9360]CAH0346023.1 hypothetical protein BCI9360_02333 [Bacillus sp. CECT 9360]
MKPLILTMQAFGPYANKEKIDFTALGNRTMFVISGKTGSGKTTIFDGISFAIYGKASGEDRNGQELRSQFADDDLSTEVTLEFTLRGKTYSIWRAPQQERKKKTGEGYVTVTSKAELYEIDAAGEKKLLGANVREVDEKIKTIMQIDANQFRQILMIPQGEFRKLLTSESKDKEQILQKLFHTELYKRIEEKLKEEAAELRKLSEKSRNDRIHLMKEIQAGDNEELITAINADEPNEQLVLPILAEEIQRSEEKITRLEAEMKQKQAARDQVQAEVVKAEELLKRFAEQEKLKLEKAALEEKKTEIDQFKSQISLAQKATVLEKQEQLYLRVGKQVKLVTGELVELKGKAVALATERAQNEKSYEAEVAKAPERDQALSEIHRLQQLSEAVQTFSTINEKTSLLERQWKESSHKRELTEANLTEMEKEAERLLLEKNNSEKAAVLYAEKERELEKNEELLNKLSKVNATNQEMLRLQETVKEKQERLEAAKQRFSIEKEKMGQLELDWRKSQAGMLAAMLEHGHPCPVCGSHEHTSPAHPPVDMPSEEALNKQKAALTAMETEKGSAESQYYQADSQCNTVKKVVTEKTEEIQGFLRDFDISRIQDYQNKHQQQKNDLARELSDLKSKKDSLVKLDEKLSVLKEKSSTAKSSLETLKKTEDTVKAQFIEENARLTGLKESVPEEIRTQEAYQLVLNKAMAAHQKLQNALEKSQAQLQKSKEAESAVLANQQSSVNQLEKLNEELEKERNSFKEDMTKQGFDTYQAYTSSKKSDNEINSLEKHIGEYEQKFHSVTGLYHDLELRLNGVEKPDVEGLQSKFRQVDSDLEGVRNLQNLVVTAKSKNAEIAGKIEEIIVEQKSLDEKYAMIGHLHEISKGQNPFKITFERYVLAAFLDDILKEANTRLLKMTSGRYQLLRKIDPTRMNIQSGLELSVYDQYTGQERHVKTLSGGESFKAALALALGLADVVQQYAGGISLETMFIDEGFGTLDPESLDNAIEALMDIQSSGRLVGIISHVPELKERIDARLEVISTQKGSSTEFQFFGV